MNKETGAAYPEMDKIIQICQKFDLKIDDLLNHDIREVKREEESKNNINKFIEDFLNYITDTVNLFLSMNFKTKIKCLFEEILIIIVLLIISLIVGTLAGIVFNSIFIGLIPNNIYFKIYNIAEGIYTGFAVVISILVLAHIFKTRYLDYYKNAKQKVTNDKVENKIELKKSEDKIIIRDPKHSEYRFINGVFKILILFIKFFALLLAMFLSLMLIGFVTCLIMSFTIIKTKIFFIGILLSMVSLSTATIVIILLLFNFIFNRKNEKKKMIWSFIGALILFGISLGLIFIGSLKFNVTSNDKTLLETKTIEIDMQNDLTLINEENIKYIEKDIDNIVIEYSINKSYELKYDILNTNGKKVMHYWAYNPNEIETIRMIIKELNNFKIININGEISNVKIYASKDNIELLKTNNKEYQENIQNQEKQYKYYEDTISQLQNELEEKQEKIYDLENEIDILKTDNE